MVLIIDGHNLIPKVRGISLDDADDEAQLIALLQAYCRVLRKTAEVYFDQAPPGMSGERGYGLVKAIFVRSGTTADEAIMARLRQLGKRARNARVVSSDRQVQQATRAVHAQAIPSEEFARDLSDWQDKTPEMDPRNRLLSEAELEAWETLFQKGNDRQKR